MITEDTPLPVVASYLPPGAAEVLMGISPAGQTYVCASVRTAVANWEQAGVVLDPMQFETVITTFVVQALGAWTAVTKLSEKILRGGACSAS